MEYFRSTKMVSKMSYCLKRLPNHARPKLNSNYLINMMSSNRVPEHSRRWVMSMDGSCCRLRVRKWRGRWRLARCLRHAPAGWRRGTRNIVKIILQILPFLKYPNQSQSRCNRMDFTDYFV